MSWISLRVRAGSGREAAIAALFAAGSQGVHEDGDSLVTYFPQDTDAVAVCARVREATPNAEIQYDLAPDIDWSEAWKSGLGAHRLGCLTVAPPWLAGALEPASTIVIDPGMAFGTGEHPTTRGAIRLLQEVVRPGDRVVDLGAGSAILAIAAAKLGATRVLAVEVDPDAIANAEENVARNRVADRVSVVEGDATILLPLVAPVRVVIANIISSVIVELLPAMALALAPGGVVILAGILVEERGDMLQLLDATGWRVEREDVEGIWWSIRIEPR